MVSVGMDRVALAATGKGGSMRRREFTFGLSCTAAWPLRAYGQQHGAVRRIGVLMTTANDPEGESASDLSSRNCSDWVGPMVQIYGRTSVGPAVTPMPFANSQPN
jgi:hypothetical protein